LYVAAEICGILAHVSTLAGVFTCTNLCVTREPVRSGDLWRSFHFVKGLNVGLIETLEPRPCGEFASRGNDTRLTRDDRNTVMDFSLRGNTSGKFKDHPLICHVAFTEAPEQADCMMGGLSHLAIDSKGNVNPRVFLPVTFGNILTEDFAAIYVRIRRAIPQALHTECPSLAPAETPLQKGGGPDGFPIPHSSIKKEWERMFSEAVTNRIMREVTVGQY